jgi:hypothetical protein
MEAGVGSTIVQFSVLCERAQHETIICDDPIHCHKTPVQEMFGVEYKGHHIAVTKDLDVFNVRIDRNPLTDKWNLSWSQVVAYVERMTA